MSKKKKTVEELLGEAVVPEEEQDYEIPENWVSAKFNSILKINSGKSLTKKQMNEEGWIPVYGGNGVTGTHDQFNVDKETIVIGRVGFYCGSVHLTPKKAWVTDNAFIVNYSEHLFDRQYLYWKLKHLNLGKYSNSSAQPVISGKTLAPAIINIPPINEQKRIAEKVERLLYKIEEAKQMIKEAKETFELRRAAILEKAFQGDLTAKWRNENRSVESAETRLEMIKKERFQIAETKKEISEITEMFDELNTEECINNIDWLYLKTNMFCYNINCGGTPSKDLSEEGEIPFLKVYNIVNNKVDFSYKPQYIPEEVHKSKLKKSILKPNDVIMNIVGPPLKKIAIIPDEYSEMNMNQAIVRFRPTKYVLPKYLYYCLQYDETLKEVINETRGVVGQSNISVSQSRNLVTPIPSLEEQSEIVSKLEKLIKREESVLNLLPDEKKLNDLKQSILSKAYRGELGTNDPSEENAIELLKDLIQEQVK